MVILVVGNARYTGLALANGTHLRGVAVAISSRQRLAVVEVIANEEHIMRLRL